MGAGQSADDSQNAARGAPIVKSSYYELLEVDKQATDDEIKKAYRRKALELHPDRNYGNVENATTLFAEIQSAYEVLSDPQERAWYDSHEDAILRNVDPGKGGGAGGAGEYEHSVGLTTADDITRMFSRFHGGVAFTDAPSGFFGFLRETFAKLAAEEERAGRQEGADVPDYPSFGHKDDTHEDVVRAFYAVWAGFSTRKTFSWRDKYSTRGVADRRTRRLIDKENKKFRDEAIREFNDAVRSLVAFVRKRDPRYRPNTQSEAERQTALREAAAAQAARQRAANAAMMDQETIPEWAKARDPEELEESEEDESDEEHFECIVCRKVFKSENQFEAHEKSKKHVKAVQALRRRLKKEGVELDLDEDGESDSAPNKEHEEEQQQESDDVVESRSNGIDATSEDKTGVADAVHDLEIDDPTADLDPAASTADGDEEDNEPEEEESIGTRGIDAKVIVDDDLSEEGRSSPDRHPDDIGQPSTPEPDSLPKLGKAAQKRAKKAAQNASADDQTRHKCAQCNAAFPSKNQLFQHIQKFGHAAPISVAKSKGKKAKGR